MSEGQGSVPPVDLTDGQRRTLRELIKIGDGADSTPLPGVAERVRSRIDEALEGLPLTDPLWLSKARMDEFARCPGMLDASLRGEHDELPTPRRARRGR